MICVAVTYVIKPGHENEAITLFQKLTATPALSSAAGCTWHIARRATRGGSSFTNNTTIRPHSMLTEQRLTSSSTPKAASSRSSKAGPPRSTLRSPVRVNQIEIHRRGVDYILIQTPNRPPQKRSRPGSNGYRR